MRDLGQDDEYQVIWISEYSRKPTIGLPDRRGRIIV
jgi:hypothetical protein